MANKIDISSFQIAASKMRADGTAYFNLFEKHVPRNLGMNDVVLLYKLDNLSCICKIVNMNIKAHYVVVSNDAVNTALQVVLDKSIDVKYIKEFDFKETDMKFDCIIMNPPYSRNLHLKILAEAIKHLKDDGTCVNLSPVRWLQDPLAKYKKNCDLKRFEESVAKHIESLEYSFKEVNDKLFNIDFGDLGIYVCSKNTKCDYAKFTAQNEILDKVINEMKKNSIPSIDNKIAYDDMPGICCLTSLVVFGVRDRELRLINGWLTQNTDILFYTDKKNDKSGETYFDYRKRVAWGNIKPKAENANIKFNSTVERQNFYNVWRTRFLRYLYDATVVGVSVHTKFLPWLGDAINPRTGLKGYTGEWTDADLYKLFEISPAEQKVIEETMEKYK